MLSFFFFRINHSKGLPTLKSVIANYFSYLIYQLIIWISLTRRKIVIEIEAILNLCKEMMICKNNSKVQIYCNTRNRCEGGIRDIFSTILLWKFKKFNCSEGEGYNPHQPLKTREGEQSISLHICMI